MLAGKNENTHRGYGSSSTLESLHLLLTHRSLSFLLSSLHLLLSVSCCRPVSIWYYTFCSSFSASLDSHLKNPKVVSLFPLFLSSLPTLPHCVFSVWVVFTVSRLPSSVSLPPSLSQLLACSAAGKPTLSPFPCPLFQSLWVPLIHYPTRAAPFGCCEVDPSFFGRTPLLRFYLPISPLSVLFWLQRSPTVRRDHLTAVPLNSAFFCAFFRSLLACFGHSCRLHFHHVLSILRASSCTLLCLLLLHCSCDKIWVSRVHPQTCFHRSLTLSLYVHSCGKCRNYTPDSHYSVSH